METQKVYSLVKKIPEGKISTYKELANQLNSKAYRTVGNILNKSKNLPCHRVIKSNSEVGGFNKGITKKTKLLKKEGIRIKNNKIQNFEKVLYTFKT